MKVVFMGTPEFAVPSLKKILEAGYDVLAVVTQPDKPKGRGKKIIFPPVKQFALENNIKVLQPDKLKDNIDFVDKLKDLSPDFIIVVAYGKILTEAILNLPSYGCINVHASLLPKYRGAAPINWAIIKGEKETGITTMYMDKGLDTGNMLLKKSIPIFDDDDAETIHDKLAILGGDVLIETIDKLIKGLLKPVKQKDEEASYAPILNKSMGLIDWSKNAVDIRNKIRGMCPWPGCYTFYEGLMLKIWKADVKIDDSNNESGKILKSDNELIIKCGCDALKILEIQSEGTRKMSIEEYLRGHNITKGTVLKGK
ncbi:methionyl-tRNA formyltransferase [Aceticella autotrophica]|uniref:Methionyl-tRNA formyltransferase n=1 Tax=Aceticella autotrophica TaxID=2755338 RepID=A0A975AUH6_9THEO|nr:methionyl-tRNA formyltransferase [Aceticella autotrophica]QSZ26673.1 methionyl-tRNA formyltransferase [Aceticella autotrophica]